MILGLNSFSAHSFMASSTGLTNACSQGSNSAYGYNAICVLFDTSNLKISIISLKHFQISQKASAFG